MLDRQVRDHRDRPDIEGLGEELDEGFPRGTGLAGEEQLPALEVPCALEEPWTGEPAREQSLVDLVLDLAPLPGTETRETLLDLARLLEPAALEPEELRGDGAPIEAKAEQQPLLEEEIRRREIAGEGVVQRHPAPGLGGRPLEVPEHPPRHGPGDCVPVESSRDRRCEADDSARGGQESHRVPLCRGAGGAGAGAHAYHRLGVEARHEGADWAMLGTMDDRAILTLVRHGQTSANLDGVWHGSTDTRLTALGQRQAAALARWLADHHRDVAAVYTSDLVRALDTARAIAATLGLEPRAEPALREYDLGAWEGLSFRELWERYRLWDRMRADPHFAPHGGETPRAVVERMVAALRRIASAHRGQRVVVVTHGGGLSMALGALLDGDYTRWDRVMGNCAVSDLVLEPAPALLRFNVAEHLADLEEDA